MSKKQKKSLIKPVEIKYFQLWFVFGLISFFVCWYFFSELKWWNLLIALQVSTILTMAIDKIAAIYKKERVPERILWLIALLGSSPALLFSMLVFRHKISKVSFQFWFAIIFLVQVVLIYFFWIQKIPLGTLGSF